MISKSEKETYNEKVKAIRDVIDLDVNMDVVDSVVFKLHKCLLLVGLSAEIKARAIKDLHDARLVAYAKYKAENLQPSMFKIVIDGETSGEQAKLELADRLNAGLVHEIDGLRTIISLRKDEMNNSLK